MMYAKTLDWSKSAAHLTGYEGNGTLRGSCHNPWCLGRLFNLNAKQKGQSWT